MVEIIADYKDVKNGKVNFHSNWNTQKENESQLKESLLDQIVALIAAAMPHVFTKID